MVEVELKIEGMSCQHCVSHVKKALDGIDGVVSYDVSVGAASVRYSDSDTDIDTITAAIRHAGYQVVNG